MSNISSAGEYSPSNSESSMRIEVEPSEEMEFRHTFNAVASNESSQSCRRAVRSSTSQCSASTSTMNAGDSEIISPGLVAARMSCSNSSNELTESRSSDSDGMDVESETGGVQSGDSHVTSRQRNRGRRRTGGRKSGKARRDSISAEEIIRRQEAACQTHNENERIRRKDLRSAVIGLRNQLVRPTKRPAVKLVLEAAIQELKDLKEKERAELELMESLKDKEKRLTFELECKLEEFKKQQSARASNPSPPSLPPGPSPFLSPSPASPAGVSAQSQLYSAPLHTLPALRPLDTSQMVSPVNSLMVYPPFMRLPTQQSPGLPTPSFQLPLVPSHIPQSPFLVPSTHPGLPPTLIQPMYTLPPPLYPSTFSPAVARFQASMQLTPQHPVQLDTQQQLLRINSPMFSQTPREQLPTERDVERERMHRTSSPRENSSPRRRKSNASKNGVESVEVECRSTSVVKYAQSADSNRAPAPSSDSERDSPITTPPAATYLEDTPLTISVVKPIPRLCSSSDNPPVTKKPRKQIPPLLRIETESDLQSLQKPIHSQKSNWEPPRFHSKLQNSLTNANSPELLTVQYYNNPYYSRHSNSLRTNSLQRKRRNTSTTDSESSSSEEDCSTGLLHSHSLAISCPGNNFSV